MTLGEIERLTKEYADAWKLLKERIEDLELEKEAAVRRNIYGIKDALGRVTDKRGTLGAAILSAPELFENPRTITMYGIKVGLQKSKGTLEIDDMDKTIRLIMRHLPEQAAVLINVKETASKDALLNLSATELKKIGARITDTTDKLVLKATDTDTEKLVKAFLKEDKMADEQEAA
ncbi:hypothetical protein [Candidatus Magnetominusculus dajiuhuensis]|uniref:hypothetical protein n=1 Tax=Candidatus Magnetominusculus dajiuhuensis TaxID=3137712 RepID=UPI003B434AF7